MSGIPKHLDEDIRDAFSLFDKQNAGKIPAQELGTVVRSVGMNPTEAEVANIVRNTLNGQPFDLQKLMAIISGFLRTKRDSEEEIRDAFRVFDRDGNGFIQANEMRHVMTNLGEKLEEREVDELFHNVEIDQEGMMQYEEMVKVMIPKS